jgi:hypothetical protein
MGQGMLRTLTAGLVLALVLEACSGPQYVTPPPVDGSQCAAAGARLLELGCRGPDGVPLWRTPGGLPFEAACRAAADDRREWRADCLARLQSCTDVDRAFRAPHGTPCP